MCGLSRPRNVCAVTLWRRKNYLFPSRFSNEKFKYKTWKMFFLFFLYYFPRALFYSRLLFTALSLWAILFSFFRKSVQDKERRKKKINKTLYTNHRKETPRPHDCSIFPFLFSSPPPRRTIYSRFVFFFLQRSQFKREIIL